MTETFTPAERKVLDALLALGAAQPKLTAHLACATGYTVNTVNTYLANLRKKCGVRTTEELATQYGTLFNPPRDGP